MNLRQLTPTCLAVAAVACSSLRPVREPARFIAEQKPPVVFVGYVSEGVGRTREMTNPHIVGDSVVGTWAEGQGPAAVPMRDVHSVAAVRRDGAKTFLFVAGIVGATSIVAYALTAGGTDGNWYCDYSPNRRGPAGEPFCGPREPGISALGSR